MHKDNSEKEEGWEDCLDDDDEEDEEVEVVE